MLLLLNKVEALKGRKDGPSRAMLMSTLGTPCLGLVGLET
jgi:hypothetical protein